MYLLNPIAVLFLIKPELSFSSFLSSKSQLPLKILKRSKYLDSSQTLMYCTPRQFFLIPCNQLLMENETQSIIQQTTGTTIEWNIPLTVQ